MKIGDKVKILRSPWGYNGAVGKIVDVTKDGFLKVEVMDVAMYFWPHDVELADRAS